MNYLSNSKVDQVTRDQLLRSIRRESLLDVTVVLAVSLFDFLSHYGY